MLTYKEWFKNSTKELNNANNQILSGFDISISGFVKKESW